MPQLFRNAVLTNAGAAMIAKANLGQCSIQFVSMQTGNGTYTEEEKVVSALQQRTALKSYCQEFVLTKVESNTSTSVVVTSDFSNIDVTPSNAYYINEIGLFAKEVGDTEGTTKILYAIAVVDGAQGDYFPPYNGYNPTHYIQNFYVTVDNSANVTIEAHDGVYALQSDMESAEARLDVLEDTLDISVTLTNSQAYPFNDSQDTVQITSPRDNTNYYVIPEVISYTGGAVGDIEVTDKLVNGFKIAFTGSATQVVLKCHVIGGVELG